MIISGNQIQSIMKIYTDQNKVAKSAKATDVAPATKKDEVILSTQAQEFGQIYQAIKALPEVREDKVKELSDRIAQGNYSVDAKEVADKMLGRLMADRLR